jgi:4-hydroxy-tetrahydrodipicolinate synthase
MPSSTRLGGIWSAALTPLDAKLQPDAGAAVAYYGDLLANGCDGINLLGTTGEAMSFGLEQRVRLMQAIAGSALPIERFMVGTGAASLEDAVQLTRAAFDLDFAAALVLPPFFFRDVTDDGVVRYFDELLQRAYAPGKRVLLYNFPRMSGMTFRADLVDRLVTEFPQAIAGLKDSSNDPALQAEVAKRQPHLSVFPASEHALIEARAYGAAGCISGSLALWPKIAAKAFAGEGEAAAQAAKLRAALAGPPLIPVMRYLTAKQRHDDAWERSIPPLTPLTPGERTTIDASLSIAREVER